MTGKELIKNVINRNTPQRIGIHFNPPHMSDIAYTGGARFIADYLPDEYREFGRHKELLAQVPWFNGDVRMDFYGNIYGAYNNKTKGECIKGALDSWSKFTHFRLPELDMSYYGELRDSLEPNTHYVVAGLPFSPFSALRDSRMMSNALMDTALEKENVAAFLERISEIDVKACRLLKNLGVDGVIFYDDWGTQDRTFISVDSFIELFQPVYAKICDAAHESGMHVILHSCGKNNEFMQPFVDAGIDVLQFDQTEIYPLEWLADHFADKVTFYVPVDIQKIMTTGDKRLIQESAKKMVQLFRSKGASIIAKEYPSWSDINIHEEWAAWAREAFLLCSDNN